MSAPGYTALIRTCNSAKTLPRTLASLRAQSQTPMTYLVVDSGSTDDTLSSLPPNALVHHYVGDEFNYSLALNQGLDLVQTDYVLIISSHTSLGNPQALEYALNILAHDDAIGAAYFSYETPGQLEHRLIDRRNFTGFNGLWNTCALIKTHLLKMRHFRPEVFAAEDQEWANWLFHSENKAIARIAGAALENLNPQRFSRHKLLNEYTAVALFTNRKLLSWSNLAKVAYTAMEPRWGRSLSDRYTHLALFWRLWMCHFAKPRSAHREDTSLAGPQRTILFLSHSASRNGASILLLHLIQWLREHSDFRFEVLTTGGGPLIDDFRAVATTRVWRNPLFFLRSIRHPVVTAWRYRLEGLLLRAFVGRRHYDLVYANTAATWNQVAILANSGDALLWHIHELPYALGLTLDNEQSRRLLTEAARVVAVSDPVRESLTNQYAVSGDRVDLIHGFVPVSDLSSAERQRRRQRILEQLGWPQDAFVVGACGGLGWRKGSDLFLQIAHRLKQMPGSSAMRFLWVGGGDKHSTEAMQFAYDQKRLGLDGLCQHVASTAEVEDYYCAMDVLALTSREDPFPLVMLEAAMQGIPTVCFASAGGGPEFVADDAGLIVPYLDLDAFAQALARLLVHPAEKASLGYAARDKAQRHHSIATQGPKLLRSIERCLAPALKK